MQNNVHDLKTESEEKRDMSDHKFYGGLSAEHLKQYIERVELLERGKNAISEDIKITYGEAKGSGFDVKTMKEILKIRKKNQSDLEEQEFLLDTYKRALGMTPLEQYAEEQKEKVKLSIEVPGGELENVLRQNKVNEPIATILGNIERMGGFRTNTEGDKALAKKFLELKLLTQHNKGDNLYMLTVKGEASAISR